MNGNEALAALAAGITVKYREIGTENWLYAETLMAKDILRGAMRIGGRTVQIEFMWDSPPLKRQVFRCLRQNLESLSPGYGSMSLKTDTSATIMPSTTTY